MRRRRRYQKPKVLLREEPVAIECHGAEDPFMVSIGKERYAFGEDAQGRLVTQVFVEDHIACFLARSEMYRQV